MSDINNLEVKKRRKELNELSEKLNSLLNSLHTLSSHDADFEDKQKEFNQKMDQIFHKMNIIRGEIYLLENKPVASNENLDIYLREGNIEDGYGFFEIFLRGTSTKIGRVTLYTYPIDDRYGNVGYGLEEEYRGHRFMLQSLEILKETMIKMKIFKPVFTVEPDNEPSIHTIQNFGGTLIKNHQEYNTWYDTYEVDLMAEKPSKKK